MLPGQQLYGFKGLHSLNSFN